MDVTVSGRHTSVSEKLRQQAVEKISPLDKYLNGMERAEVHFWEEKNPRIGDKEICEVTMVGHGHHVRCKVSAPDGFTAVDLAVDKLERQLRKLKTKVQRRNHKREKLSLPADIVPEKLVDGEDAGPMYNIVKSKRFKVDVLDPQAAALHMDLLNHDFFVFENSETDNAAVLYRRQDGNIGLIDVS